MKRAIVLIIAMVLLLGSCGAAISDVNMSLDEPMSNAGFNAYDYEYGEKAVSYTYDSAPTGGGGGGGYASEEPMAKPAEIEPVPDAQSPRKLIKRASLTIETKEFEDAVAAVEKTCADFDGYIESSSVYGGSAGYIYSRYYDQRSAYYIMRIPSKDYDAFLKESGKIGNITHKSQNTEDITSQYYDIASRLAAVETRRDRLMDLLEKADTMESIIQLEKALSDTIYEIDSYTGSLRKYDNQVDYSFVEINLSEVIEFTPEELPPPITLGERISDAGSAAWGGLVNGTQALLIWFIRNVFVLIILAIIAVAVILIVRRSIKKAKKASKASKKAPPQTIQPPKSEDNNSNNNVL